MSLFGEKCPRCDARNDKNASFCKQCGQDLSGLREVRVEGNGWQARPDEFATSLSVADLEGLFTKRLEVFPGYRALIFQNGRFQGSVPAGEYTLDTFLGKFNRLMRNKNIRVIVTREAELAVDFELSDVLTREFLPLEVELSLGLRIDEPELFAGQLMGSGYAYSVLDLRRLLLPRLRQVLSEHIGARGIRELNAASGLRAELDGVVEQSLTRTLADNGLALGEIHTVAVGHTQFDANNRERAKAWLEVDQERSRLEHRKALDELYGDEEWRRIAHLETEQQIRAKARDIEIRSASGEYADRLRRIELLEKIRKADVREAVIEQGAREELLKLEEEAKRLRLDREDERTGWEHVRKLAEIKRETELSQSRIGQERSITLARAELDRERELGRFDHEIAMAAKVDTEEGRRQKAELERKRTKLEFDRNQEIHGMRHRLELDAINRQMMERQREFERVQAYQDWVHQKERDEWEDDKKGREDGRKFDKLRKLAELDMQYDEQERKAELHRRDEDRKDKEQAARLERDRIEAMGSLGAEALASMAPSDERARIIADMQRAKGMQNMGEEQILAMAAERNPALVEALKERYRNSKDTDLSERERQLYDRLLSQQESQQDRVDRAHREAQMGQQSMMNKVLDTMAAIQQDRPAAQQPVLITPGSGTVTTSQPIGASAAVDPGATGRKVVICAGCRSENPPLSRFCSNCGKGLG